MLDPKKPMTHVAWAQYYQGGRFREWIEIGMARIEVDGNGKTIAHIHTNRIPRGDSGNIFLFPIGEKPPDPQPQAKRPGQISDDVDVG